MNIELLELKFSLKELTQNLIIRIESVCQELEIGGGVERLTFWLDDLSTLTEGVILLTNNNIVILDIDLFNEKVEMLLSKIEEKDYLFVSDLLKYEIKPLLSYWDECITND